MSNIDSMTPLSSTPWRTRPREAMPIVAIAALMIATRAPAAGIAATVTDDRGQPVAHAVVIAMPVDGNVRLPTNPPREIVDQVKQEFEPKVKAIVVGTPVIFPNKDKIRHHVYSFSPAKRFEVPLYAGVPAQPVVFDKAGVVVLGCNIHDWMVGYVYVSESPYFGTTGEDGTVVIEDLPPRAYAVRVWHPQSDVAEEATKKTVDLAKVKQAEVAWTLTLKPEQKVRRAPAAGHAAHY